MAVLIASDLAKDIAGEPLLRGVSFKLERRDRLTIAGRNGAGKTTLLRMLAGETSVDGGELVFARACASRCTTSARRASATSRCATTCSPARSEPLELEDELRALEERDGRGRRGGDERATPTSTARFEAAGGYTWRERARRSTSTASGSPTPTSTAS